MDYDYPDDILNGYVEESLLKACMVTICHSEITDEDVSTLLVKIEQAKDGELSW